MNTETPTQKILPKEQKEERYFFGLPLQAPFHNMALWEEAITWGGVEVSRCQTDKKGTIWFQK